MGMATSTFLWTEIRNRNSYPTVSLFRNWADWRRKSLWGTEIAENPPAVDYNEIMSPETSHAGVGKWTKNIVLASRSMANEERPRVFVCWERPSHRRSNKRADRKTGIHNAFSLWWVLGFHERSQTFRYSIHTTPPPCPHRYNLLFPICRSPTLRSSHLNPANLSTVWNNPKQEVNHSL